MRRHLLDFTNPWDLEEVYGGCTASRAPTTFDPEQEQYLVHITTGTHIAQICMFLLTESRHFPARLIQTSPPIAGSGAPKDGRARSSSSTSTCPSTTASRRASRRSERGLSFLKSGIATRNAAFNRLIERIEQVAIAPRTHCC